MELSGLEPLTSWVRIRERDTAPTAEGGLTPDLVLMQRMRVMRQLTSVDYGESS
jgi:hypothetical protein